MTRWAGLRGPSFPGDWRSCERQWRCNNTASLLTTVAWLRLGSISETHTHAHTRQVICWLIRHTYKSHVSVCTVRCCMMSCSRAELAISWLWSGVCCSNSDRICPSWGSSASFRSLTCISCRSVRSRRGTALNADTQAPHIASLEVVDKLVSIPDMGARDRRRAQISGAKKCRHTPFVVGFLRWLLEGDELSQ